MGTLTWTLMREKVLLGLLAAMFLSGSALGSPSDGFSPKDDREQLTALQKNVFNYVLRYTDPTSRLALERSNDPDLASVSATGFSVAATVVAVKRGFVSRKEALDRLLGLVRFLEKLPDRQRLKGAFPHWMHAKTGVALEFSKTDQDADLVETAFLFEGLLIAREYFNRPDPAETELRNIVTRLWHDLDFTAFLTEDRNGLYWHYSPKDGQLKMPIRGFNEALIAYVLALSSPTHPVPVSVLKTWYDKTDYQTRTYWGFTIEGSVIYSGPLFHTHYSFIGLDPKKIADRYVPRGYDMRAKTQAMIHHRYCLTVADPAKKFSEGLWGLTSSFTPKEYLYSSPVYESGTVAPTAALSSFPFVPQFSSDVLYELAKTPRYNTNAGPVDAIHPSSGWVSSILIGIDQLPICSMVENYRSGLLWDLFMSIDEIRSSLSKARLLRNTFTTDFSYPKNDSEEFPVAHLRRHPDRERYEVSFTLEDAARVTFTLMDAAKKPIWKVTDSFHRGEAVLTLPKDVSVTTRETYHLTLETTKDVRRLAIRFH